MASNIVNGGSTPLSTLSGEQLSEALQYVQQELNTTQMAQARTNMGIASASKVIYLGTIIKEI